jgi:hypothetical protein
MEWPASAGLTVRLKADTPAYFASMVDRVNDD